METEAASRARRAADLDRCPAGRFLAARRRRKLPNRRPYYRRPDIFEGRGRRQPRGVWTYPKASRRAASGRRVLEGRASTRQEGRPPRSHLCGHPAALTFRRRAEGLPARGVLQAQEIPRLPALLDVGGEPGPKARAALVARERVAARVVPLAEAPARLLKVGVGRRL